MNIVIDQRGAVFWEKEEVNLQQLATKISLTSTILPAPFLILSADERAPCEKVREVRSLMNSRYCKNRWQCGEGEGKWKEGSMTSFPHSTDLANEADRIADAAR